MSGLEGLLAGRVLGNRYRVEEVIGRGGMGAVYRGVDERLGRQVAVKVITVSGGGDTDTRDRLRARFHREARAAAALPHHPNVVPVYDYGSDQALGLDYLVMELLRGSDLATRLARSGPPPLAAALRILYEAARGVAVGHRAGLIHRDVKPGNIFLAETGHDEVQVRVVDFGIAKLIEDEDTFNQLTQDGRVPHSPAYASPEQLRGLSQLTPASDVFSLGAVGYTLLTGERPFSEADRNRMSLGMPVPAPSVRAKNPAVPASVDAILRRALAFEPAERYPNAGAMAAELDGALRELPRTPLEPYLAGGAAAPPAAPRAPADERTQLLADEGDRTLLAPPPGEPTAAAPPRRRPPPPPPERKRGIGGKIVWTLVFLVLAAAGLWIFAEMNGEPGPVAEQIPPPPDSIDITIPTGPLEPEIGADPAVQAFNLNEEGKRLYQAGDFAAALEHFRLARELAPESPEYRYNYGLALHQLGRFAEAATELERATRLDPGNASALYYLGLSALAVGDTGAARAALQRVRATAAEPRLRAAALQLLQQIEIAQRTGPTPPPIDTTPALPTPTPPDTARPDTARLRPDTALAARP